MISDNHRLKRRTFLKQATVMGLGALAGAVLPRMSWSASKERLTILSSIGLDTLHPYAHSSGPQYGIWQNMLDPLVEINYTRKEYYGVLAESWEFQGKKWVFRLKKGIRFHNGSPFTAQDVVHSINRMKNDKKSLQKSSFDDLTEIQAQDDYTVVFTTEVPNAVFLDRLHNRFMISKSAAEKYSDDVDQHAIGTGPYKYVSWQRDGNLVMTRNDDYWGPKAAIKEIVLRKVGEDAARLAGLGRGTLSTMSPSKRSLA
jgi:peptide/nickel transport system substrate-binding protein